MAIKFFNIRSKEVRLAETEPQITAMWASSDHSPNITQGQDFGWRLAPEVVVEMKRIKQSGQLLQTIASRYNMALEDIKEPEILRYISEKTEASQAPVAVDGDYTDEYEQEIRKLERQAHEDDLPKATQQTVTTTTTAREETIEELEARLAARKKRIATTTTTTTKK